MKKRPGISIRGLVRLLTVKEDGCSGKGKAHKDEEKLALGKGKKRGIRNQEEPSSCSTLWRKGGGPLRLGLTREKEFETGDSPSPEEKCIPRAVKKGVGRRVAGKRGAFEEKASYGGGVKHFKKGAKDCEVVWETGQTQHVVGEKIEKKGPTEKPGSPGKKDRTEKKMSYARLEGARCGGDGRIKRRLWEEGHGRKKKGKNRGTGACKRGMPQRNKEEKVHVKREGDGGPGETGKNGTGKKESLPWGSILTERSSSGKEVNDDDPERGSQQKSSGKKEKSGKRTRTPSESERV